MIKNQYFCCLCLNYETNHQPTQNNLLLEVTKDLNQEQLYFKGSCGHYYNKICLVDHYLKHFEVELLHNDERYKRLQKQDKDGSNYFQCNQCNHILCFEEVKKQIYDIIIKLRAKRSKFTCLICYETDLDRDCESVSLTECSHIFCTDCIRTYIISNINNLKFQYDDMKCPSEGCNQPINNFIVDRLICNPENINIYNRMCRLQLSNFCNNEKDSKVTQCPGFLIRNKKTQQETKADQEMITQLRLGQPPKLSDDQEMINCPVFFSFNTKKVKIYECKICSYSSCLKGCEDFHSSKSKRGKSCKDFQKWKQLNQKLDEDIRAILDDETICQCPQCKAIIIRNGGCNHMTCTMPNCGYEFCFKCSSKWLCWKHLHYF